MQTIIWTLYEEDGSWRYSFGLKGGTMTTSQRMMTKEMAIKSFNQEVEKLQRQFGPNQKIIIEQI